MIKTLTSFLMGTLFSLSVSAAGLGTLKENNVVTLRGPVTGTSVAQTQLRLLKLSSVLPKTSTIVLFLDTPGGSISAGLNLIETAKALPQNVVTVTNFAASMGFIIAESLGTRYVLPSGTYMSHRAKTSLRGQVPGELNSELDYIQKIVTDIDSVMSKRLGISVKEYKAKIHDEYWTYGQRAVDAGVADKVLYVRCEKALAEKIETIKVQTMFGPVKAVFSACPLVSAPLKIDFSGATLWGLPTEKKLAFKNAIRSMFLDKISFTKNYVIPGKLEFLK